MPLHKIARPGDPGTDDVYATPASDQHVPKYRLPEHTSSAQEIYTVVHDELLLDGNSRQNLATFCTTWVEPEAHRLMDEKIDKNMIDKDEYPQTAEIENRCVQMLADLWHAPGAETRRLLDHRLERGGMLGGLSLKWQWRKRRSSRRENRPTEPNLVCGPVQVCWHKFARYFDVELREVPIEPATRSAASGRLRQSAMRTPSAWSHAGRDLHLRLRAGRGVARALDGSSAKTGLDIPIHVDAASGGFVAPFIHQDLEWDFRLQRVKSINTSGHKYGLSPLGVGWVIWRDKARTAGGTDLLGRLPGRQHADLRAQLQPARRRDHRPVL